MIFLNKKTQLFLVALMFCLFWSGAAFAQEAKKSVAILPFKLNAPPDKAYLKEGLRDMLGSRITSETGSAIVPKAKVDAALQGSGGTLLAQNMGPYAKKWTPWRVAVNSALCETRHRCSHGMLCFAPPCM